MIINLNIAGRQRWTWFSACLFLSLITRVQAQDNTSNEESWWLEEVIVTAQRKEQSANDVGMDIQSMSSERLERLRIRDVEDIQAVVPSFTVAQSYQGVPTYTLRGIGFNTINISSKSTVGTYVDEVAYPYPSLNAGPVYDLQRVEVLKGPQGTLFGRNTTAGLINLVTNKPTAEFESMLRAEVGNYSTTNYEGMVSGPLSEDVAARVAVRSERSREGWQKSNTRDEELGEVDRQGARLSLSWQPTDKTQVDFSYNWWHNQSDMLAAQAIALTPSTVDSLFNAPGLVDYLANNQPKHSDEADWAPRETRSPDIGTGLGMPGDLAEDSELNAFKLQVSQELGDDMRLVLLSGYHDLEHDGLTDFSGAPYELLLQDLHGEIESFSQEIRIEGSTDIMKWLLGAYYAEDDLLDSNRTMLGENANVGLVRSALMSLLGTPFNEGGYTAQEASQAFRTYRDQADMEVQSWSIFANAEWALSDTLSLITGIRYTEDQQDYAGCSMDFNGNMLPNANVALRFLFLQTYGFQADPIEQGDCHTFNAQTGTFGLVESELDENNVAWRLALNWRPNDDTLVYATISRGAKAGETPVNPASLAAQNAPVKQEELLAYELGVKATMLNGRLQANTSVFYYDYKDKQLAVLFADPIYTALPRLDNVPDSEAYGLDTEISWRLTNDLTTIAAFTLLHTEIMDYVGVNLSGQLEDFDGAEFLYSPDKTASLTFLYQHPISDTLNVSATLNGRYQSESQADLQGLDDYVIDAYGVINASVGLFSADGRWDLSVWGANLADEYYWSTVTTGANTVVRFPGKSRTYGASLTHRF